MKSELLEFKKNLVRLPTAVRQFLIPDSHNCFVITIDISERCLLLYREEDWAHIEKTIASLSVSDPMNLRVQRLLLGHASDLTISMHGETLFPGELKTYAKISNQALLLRQGRRFELWDPVTYINRIGESSHIDKDLVEWDVELSDLYPKSRLKRALDNPKRTKELYSEYWRSRGVDFSQRAQEKLFISYSSQDKAYVEKIVEGLKEKGCDIWVDYNELLPGDSLVGVIQQEISNSSFFMPVLSETSVNSEWCKRELFQAINEEIHRKEVFVVPAVIDDCKVPEFILDKVYADLRPENYDKGIAVLSRRFL